MQVINSTSLKMAIKAFVRQPEQVGWCGRNAEYANYWRKLIKADFARRHVSKIARLAIKGKIKQARYADKCAAFEERWSERNARQYGVHR